VTGALNWFALTAVMPYKIIGFGLMLGVQWALALVEIRSKRLQELAP